MKKPHLLLRIHFILGVFILIMVNLVSTNSFFKLDLTGNDAYSLSQVSRETLAMIEDPLRVKVFYTEELPAPYNGVRRYLLDLLREYEGAGSEYFSYEIIDPASPEGKNEASRYGLRQVEIQEVRSDEFQSRAVYMGAVVLFGNMVEAVDQLNTTSGLEYRLTTAMRSAVIQADALSGTGQRVGMRVIASPSLSQINIDGFRELESTMRGIHQRVNEDNYGRIDFEFLQPENDTEIEALSRRFGLEPITWRTAAGERNQGLLEIALTYEDRTERIPLNILSGLFGGYSLQQPEEIEESVRRGLRSLVSANPRIAYAVGSGELDLQDPQQGAAAFSMLLDERFEVVPVDLSSEAVPGDIDTLIINGPRNSYSEAALYRIDQFVMNGGGLFVLLDRHIQNIPTQQQMMAGARPTWEKNTTGLEEMLDAWGADITENIVLDRESFISRQQNREQQLYQVPILQGDSINRQNVITSGLEDIILLNAGEIRPAFEGSGGNGSDKDESAGNESEQSPVYRVLLESSPEGWTVPDPSAISPSMQGPPNPEDTERLDLAVLLEGSFGSTFDGPVDLQTGGPPESGKTADLDSPADSDSSTDSDSPADTAASAAVSDNVSGFSGGRFRRESAETSRIVIVGTSAITTSQLLDPQSRTPNGTFLLNTVDYINGAPGFAELRSKGLETPRLQVPFPSYRLVVRWGNTILVPLLVLGIGLVVWFRRRSRSRRIKAYFQDKPEVQI